MNQPNPVTTLLQLTAADVLLKGVTTNHEKHGDDFVPVLDVKCETMVPPDAMAGLLGEYCDRTLFNAKGELREPADVFKHTELPLPYGEDLVAQHVSFTLSDNIERSFGEEPEEGDEAKPSQVCQISGIRYEPKVGGLVWLGFSVRLRPRDAQEVWAFLEHRGRHGKLTIAESAIQVGKGRQQQLPLTQPGEGFAAARGAATNGAHPVPDEQNTDTRGPAQVPADDPGNGAAAGGESAPAPNSEPSREPARAAQNGHALDDIGPKTRAEIENHAKRRNSRVIDGRSRGAH